MEFGNPEQAKTPGQCARMFCATVQRVLTYAIKNVANEECSLILDDIRAKYRTANGTLFTEEQLTEKIGAILIKMEAPIQAYDENFFLRVSIQDLVNPEDRNKNPVTDSHRKQFYQATTPRTRTTILDALNLMLILYARYHMLRRK